MTPFPGGGLPASGALPPGAPAPDYGPRDQPPSFPRGTDEPDDGRQLFSGVLEGIGESAAGFAVGAAKNYAYGLPLVGPAFFAYDLYKGAQNHGGGLGAYYVALNEMWNPVYGIVEAGEGAYRAAVDGDNRKLGNQLAHLAIGVIAAVALLEAGGEGGEGAGEGAGKGAGEGAGKGKGAAGKGEEGGGEGGRTEPTGEKGGRPQGKPEGVRKQDDLETQRGIQRQNESADTLAKAGYKVEQLPKSKVQGQKNPDFRIEGEIFDAYSPNTPKASNIAKALQNKINRGQASRFVLNLEDSGVTLADLQSQLQTYPIKGLEEIVVIKNGEIIRFFPFS
jgi:Contact-dependent growth inhibition CdiA C-terminal domain